MRIKVVSNSVLIPELYNLYGTNNFSRDKELEINEEDLINDSNFFGRMKYLLKIGAIKRITTSHQIQQPPQDNKSNNDIDIKILLEKIQKQQEILNNQQSTINDLISKMESSPNNNDLIAQLTKVINESMPKTVIAQQGNNGFVKDNSVPDFVPSQSSSKMTIEKSENVTIDFKKSKTNSNIEEIRKKLQELK